jgi:hypothetical protein
MRQSLSPALARCIAGAVEQSADACTRMLGSGATLPSSHADGLQQRQRMTVWRLVSDYQQAAGGPLALSDILARISHEIEGTRDTLILWVDAIESMIQKVEALYGPAPGQGVYKAEQVKAAIVYMMEKANRSISGSSLIVTEMGLEVIVSWVVDGVVLILNRRGLWQLPPGAALRLTLWFRWQARLAVLLLDGLGILRRWLEGRTEMLPQVRAIADDVDRQQAGNLVLRLREGLDFAGWAIDNRQQLLALLDLVATATVEAESFLEMTGSEKQRYARELILVTLKQQWDQWPAAPVLDAVVGSLIDFAIDAVVRLFNKRSMFTHHATAQQVPAPVAA